MKKTIIIIVVVLLIALGLWKFVIKTSKVDLTDGSSIYKKGGNYYMSNSTGEVKIDEAEYNRLKNHVEGSCTNPNITTQSVQECNYFSYKGMIDDCGNCVIATPITRICAPIGAACKTAGKQGELRLISADAKGCNYGCYTIE